VACYVLSTLEKDLSLFTVLEVGQVVSQKVQTYSVSCHHFVMLHKFAAICFCSILLNFLFVFRKRHRSVNLSKIFNSFHTTLRIINGFSIFV
jgi:hypothetical protein